MRIANGPVRLSEKRSQNTVAAGFVRENTVAAERCTVARERNKPNQPAGLKLSDQPNAPIHCLPEADVWASAWCAASVGRASSRAKLDLAAPLCRTRPYICIRVVMLAQCMLPTKRFYSWADGNQTRPEYR